MKNRFTDKMIRDLRVELLEEFDRNFERKGFFSKPWKTRKYGRNGTLMLVKGGGGLRGSISAAISENAITFSSSLPYADIHNEGGKIIVTGKMKRFFWAKYYELSGRLTFNVKTRKIASTRRNKSAASDADFYKNLALMKVGSKITMPERRFIGHAPEVDMAVKRVVDDNFNDIEKYINSRLKPI